MAPFRATFAAALDFSLASGCPALVPAGTAAASDRYTPEYGQLGKDNLRYSSAVSGLESGMSNKDGSVDWLLDVLEKLEADPDYAAYQKKLEEEREAARVAAEASQRKFNVGLLLVLVVLLVVTVRHGPFAPFAALMIGLPVGLFIYVVIMAIRAS